MNQNEPNTETGQTPKNYKIGSEIVIDDLRQETKPIIVSESDTKQINLQSGQKLKPIGSNEMQPTDSNLPSKILRQAVSDSMSLIDSAASDLLILMRQVAKPLNDEHKEGIQINDLDRAKTVGGLARELKELIKVKVDAARVVKDMIL